MGVALPTNELVTRHSRQGDDGPRGVWQCPPTLPCKRGSEATEGRGHIAHHQLGFEPEHAIPGASERRIPARISACAFDMIRTIHLNHEALRRREEVSDESPKQRHLATEYHAQTTPADLSPKELLALRQRSAHFRRAPPKQRSATFALTAKQGLVVGSSHAPHGAGGMPAPHRTPP